LLCQWQKALGCHTCITSNRGHPLEENFCGGKLFKEETLEENNCPSLQIRNLLGGLLEIVKFGLDLLIRGT